MSISIRSVSSLGAGADRPGWHLPGGDTRMKKKLWLNLQRTVEKRGRVGKKRSGVTPYRGWHPSEIKKWQWWAKKVVSFLKEKIGVTPSVAAPGDTNPNDATGFDCICVRTLRGHLKCVHRKQMYRTNNWLTCLIFLACKIKFVVDILRRQWSVCITFMISVRMALFGPSVAVCRPPKVFFHCIPFFYSHSLCINGDKIRSENIVFRSKCSEYYDQNTQPKFFPHDMVSH